MKATCLRKLAPSGQYIVTLDRIEPERGQYGRDVWRWAWVVAEGQYKDQELIRITGTTLRPNSGLGALAEQLLGREIQVGEEIDLATFLGKRFRVTAVAYANGDGAEIVKIEPVIE